MTLPQVLSAAGERAITVKGTFQGKTINILVETGCDIVCISSRIAPRISWKKVHGLKVRGFNGGIVNCPAKCDIEWSMGDIATQWKNAWVLPTMAYDIIIRMDWMTKHNPQIDFQERRIKVNG